MRYLLILVSSFVLIFSSCDPLRHMVVENQSNDTVRFDINLKKYAQTAPNSNVYPPYHLKLARHESETILFHIGQWDEATLRDFAQEIEAIEIQKNEENRLYNTSEEIYQFLKKHRGTFFHKHAIRITIK